MTIRVISAVRAEDGSTRARVRVESEARNNGRATMTMNVLLWLPAATGPELVRPLPERVYDEALRYLDIE